MSVFKVILASTFLLSFQTGPAAAATSEWMNAHDFQRFSRKHLRKKNVPTSIRCKPAQNTRGLTRYNTMIQVTYKETNKRIRWHWAWGTSVGVQNRKLPKKGFKRVSFYQSVRKSGLKLPCAIWHKAL